MLVKNLNFVAGIIKEKNSELPRSNNSASTSGFEIPQTSKHVSQLHQSQYTGTDTISLKESEIKYGGPLNL